MTRSKSGVEGIIYKYRCLEHHNEIAKCQVHHEHIRRSSQRFGSTCKRDVDITFLRDDNILNSDIFNNNVLRRGPHKIAERNIKLYWFLNISFKRLSVKLAQFIQIVERDSLPKYLIVMYVCVYAQKTYEQNIHITSPFPSSATKVKSVYTIASR